MVTTVKKEDEDMFHRYGLKTAKTRLSFTAPDFKYVKVAYCDKTKRFQFIGKEEKITLLEGLSFLREKI